MIQIDQVEISYFRSIHTLKIKNLRDIVVLSGKNDCGKSNIIKALNLFFNGHTDWHTSLAFYRDFSHARLAEVRESIKAKQFIRVKIGFIRGDRYQGSLPEKFQVTKTWYRDSAFPEVKSSISAQFAKGEVPAESVHRAEASLQRYLNTIRFEYVPAVKDRAFFRYLLGTLQETILDKKVGEVDVSDSVAELNSSMEAAAHDLKKEFENVCGIETDITLPEKMAELFRAFTVSTRLGDQSMPLESRGDGVQTRFIPSLLHYVAQRSTAHWIWGFEEPENCLEFARATSLAKDLSTVYAVESQIFTTSHSPALLAIERGNSTIVRVFTAEHRTEAVTVWPTSGAVTQELADKLKDELGLLEFQQEQQKQFEEKMSEIQEQRSEVERIRTEVEAAKSPVLVTEGKTDAAILTEARKRLGMKTNYRIIPADPLGGDGGGSGGVSAVIKCLESVRPDMPITLGVFDHDEEGVENGIKKLSKNFVKFDQQEYAWVQKKGTSGALTLPPPVGREAYATALNLTIEFYFSDEDLGQKVANRGLVFTQKEITRRVGRKALAPTLTTEPEYRVPDNAGKTYFADKIVPSFQDESFSQFRPLFERIEEMFMELERRRNT
jgi:predicted ATPase